VNILGRRHICRAVAFNFGEGFGTALANGRVAGVFADAFRIIPAALAFRAVGAFDLYRSGPARFGWNGCSE